MSTDIKPGQEEFEKATTAARRLGETITEVARRRGAVVDAFVEGLTSTTPAPLDPSKVKAGDTVTLTKDSTGAEAKGTVNALFDAGDGALDVSISGFGPTFRTPGLWTLTRHQPAPEPEPEWADGTVAEVTYNNADETEQFKSRALRGDESWVPFADVSDLIMDDEVTDVRPLVVVDPAGLREQVAEIARATFGGPNEAWLDFGDAVLALLRGESRWPPRRPSATTPSEPSTAP